MRIHSVAALAIFALAGTAGAQSTTHHMKTESKTMERTEHRMAKADERGESKAQKVEESQAALEREAKTTMKEARALAEKTVPGATIQAGEIEREGGKLIYSFDMKRSGRSGIDEVNIDAMTGALISNKHETPKAERAEARADARAARMKAKP